MPQKISPGWKDWIKRPFKCIKWHLIQAKKNLFTLWFQLTHRGARKKAWRRILIFLKKNALAGTAALSAYGAFTERKGRRQAEAEMYEQRERADFLESKERLMNIGMDQAFIAWAEVTLSEGRSRITGTNYAYDKMFSTREIDMLGHDNIELFDSIGRVYVKNNGLAILEKEGFVIVPEPNYADKDKELISIKKAFIGRDTVIRMFIFYKDDFDKYLNSNN